MKIRRRSALAGGLVAALVTGLGVGAAPAQAAAASTLTVQADQAFRPVTHVATGSLYGLADGSTPGLGTILPIKPSEFVQMAADGQRQPTGDITKVAGLANQAGAKVSGASTAAGATLVQWGDTGTSDHLWTLTAA